MQKRNSVSRCCFFAHSITDFLCFLCYHTISYDARVPLIKQTNGFGCNNLHMQTHTLCHISSRLIFVSFFHTNYFTSLGYAYISQWRNLFVSVCCTYIGMNQVDGGNESMWMQMSDTFKIRIILLSVCELPRCQSFLFHYLVCFWLSKRDAMMLHIRNAFSCIWIRMRIHVLNCLFMVSLIYAKFTQHFSMFFIFHCILA